MQGLVGGPLLVGGQGPGPPEPPPPRGSTHRKFEVRTCDSLDMCRLPTDRQTDKHACHNTPLPYKGGGRSNDCATSWPVVSIVV